MSATGSNWALLMAAATALMPICFLAANWGRGSSPFPPIMRAATASFRSSKGSVVRWIARRNMNRPVLPSVLSRPCPTMLNYRAMSAPLPTTASAALPLAKITMTALTPASGWSTAPPTGNGRLWPICKSAISMSALAASRMIAIRSAASSNSLTCRPPVSVRALKYGHRLVTRLKCGSAATGAAPKAQPTRISSISTMTPRSAAAARGAAPPPMAALSKPACRPVTRWFLPVWDVLIFGRSTMAFAKRSS